MRPAFDFSPLFRSTIGFDRLPRLLETAAGVDEATLGYPPYNIEKIDDDSYSITMAVAGFQDTDLELETRENTLTVSGQLADKEETGTFLHRGFAARPFQRKFQLADHVKVTGAQLDSGLLRIELVREIPEAKKPRQIQIDTAAAHGASRKDRKITSTAKQAT